MYIFNLCFCGNGRVCIGQYHQVCKSTRNGCTGTCFQGFFMLITGIGKMSKDIHPADRNMQITGSNNFITIIRNVLIYFRDERARQVVKELSALLKPGGVLLVGVSESLLRFGTTLVCEERAGSFFYRKEA